MVDELERHRALVGELNEWRAGSCIPWATAIQLSVMFVRHGFGDGA